MSNFSLVLIFLLYLFRILMETERISSFLQIPEGSDFPLENIPFGVYSRKATPELKACATRLGKKIRSVISCLYIYSLLPKQKNLIAKLVISSSNPFFYLKAIMLLTWEFLKARDCSPSMESYLKSFNQRENQCLTNLC